VYLTRERGYFSQAGLTLDVVELPGAAQGVPLLAAGELDAAFMGADPGLMNAIARGARARIVAAREIASPSCGNAGVLYVARHICPGGRFEWKQLKGKRIAIEGPSHFSEFCLDTFLASAQMTASDVQVIRMREADRAAALAGGRLDAVISSHLEKNLEDLSGVVRAVGMADIIPNHQYSFIVFGKALLGGDPKTGTDFLAAYLRGNREFMEGATPAYFDDLARLMGMDLALARRACRQVLSRDGALDPHSIQMHLDWAMQKKYAPDGMTLDQLIDTRFQPAAVKRLGWVEQKT